MNAVGNPAGGFESESQSAAAGSFNNGSGIQKIADPMEIPLPSMLQVCMFRLLLVRKYKRRLYFHERYQL